MHFEEWLSFLCAVFTKAYKGHKDQKMHFFSLSDTLENIWKEIVTSCPLQDLKNNQPLDPDPIFQEKEFLALSLFKKIIKKSSQIQLQKEVQKLEQKMIANLEKKNFCKIFIKVFPRFFLKIIFQASVTVKSTGQFGMNLKRLIS